MDRATNQAMPDQKRVEPSPTADGLALFLLEPDSGRSRIIARNLAISVLVHLVVFFFLSALPEVVRPARVPEIVADLRKAVTLVAPRFTDLTQKDPNEGKVSRSVDVRSSTSAPQPALPRTPTTTPAPTPPSPTPAPTQVPAQPAIVEAPKIEVAVNAGMPAGGGGVPQLPPAPPSQPAPSVDKPKLAFETVTGASVRSTQNPAVTTPRNSIQDLARASSRPGSGGVNVGDELDPVPTVGLPGQVPAPGKMGSNLQLLSDPAGVDFKPYLVQVLGIVRHNWMAVIPESARLGRKGLVVVQFIIDREGKVPKLVIASPSGTAALDRAAVAGVSMSHPFPPLPAGYKGDEVRLQLAFAYNTSK
jgi:TonB family protein